jgi:hypothetical protein
VLLTVAPPCSIHSQEVLSVSAVVRALMRTVPLAPRSLDLCHMGPKAEHPGGSDAAPAVTERRAQVQGPLRLGLKDTW